MTEKPLVSYVVGVRNMGDTIGNTIESLLNQNYPNKEIIVINDGSTDNTDEILSQYPIKFIKTKKKGISNARNLGYKQSKGDFIAFTDADCELDPEWTNKIIEGFTDDNIGIIGGITKFRKDESFVSKYRSIEFSKRFKNIKKRDVVWAGGPGSMFRRDILDKIGGFNPEWRYGEDAEISFYVIEHGYKILKINDAITYHMPENKFWRLVRKGFRDAKAYTRVLRSHIKTSFHNKFNSTWYFPYDAYLLPILYAFLIVSFFLLPIFYFIDFFVFIPFFSEFFVEILWYIWFWLFILISIFLFIYGLIPSYQVAAKSKNKRIYAFLGTILLHNFRGVAWGFGLLVGLRNLLHKKSNGPIV
ncbi:MAG: glycosyltransferase [Promethearchaeota archaeon]